MRSMSSRASRVCLALTAVALTTLPALGQTAVPVGEEFRVNNPTPFSEDEPVVAFSPGGSYVVVWANARQGIRGRVLRNAGEAVSDDVLLVANSELPPNPGKGEFIAAKHPAVVFHPSGDFYLLWTEERSFVRLAIFQQTTEVLEQRVLGQRFNLAGRPTSPRFPVHLETPDFQSRPKVGLVDERTLVVAWESLTPAGSTTEVNGVHAQRVDVAAGPIGAPIQVNQRKVSDVPRPVLAVDGRGNTLFVWAGTDDDGAGIRARLFDDSLSPLGPEVLINQNTVYDQKSAAVTASRGGQFLIAWQSELVPFDNYRIFGRFLTRSGVPRGKEFQISADLGTADGAPAVATGPTGAFLAVWLIWVKHAPSTVAGAELDLTGQRMTEVFAVSSAKVGVNRRLGFGANPNGEFVAAWEGILEREPGISARVIVRPVANSAPNITSLGTP